MLHNITLITRSPALETCAGLCALTSLSGLANLVSPIIACATGLAALAYYGIVIYKAIKGDKR